MKRIPLVNGRGTVAVDDADFETLSITRWYLNEGYAYGYVEGRRVAMHRLLAGATQGEEVDHANGDRLDNRRCNLRKATRSQNQHNRGRQKNNTSGFKGVTWSKARGRWWAYIWLDRKQRSLGYHDTPDDAARAYDRKAIELYGEFARTNFPLSDYL